MTNPSKISRRLLCIFYLSCILQGLSFSMDAGILPTITWDPKNIIFNNTKCPNGNSLNARFGDTLYLLCPNRYLNNDIIQHQERISNLHYNMYITTNKTSYENCNSTNAQLLYSCSPNSLTGERLIDYKALFFRMASGSSSIMLDQGKTYYIFSTSDGTKAGLSKRFGGKCRDSNMKLEIKFCKSEEDCPVTHELCNSVQVSPNYFNFDQEGIFSNVYEKAIIACVALLSALFGYSCRSVIYRYKKSNQVEMGGKHPSPPSSILLEDETKKINI